jgi:hypothetical protein
MGHHLSLLLFNLICYTMKECVMLLIDPSYWLHFHERDLKKLYATTV